MGNLGTLVKEIGGSFREFGKDILRGGSYHFNPLNDLENGRILTRENKFNFLFKHVTRGGIVGLYAGVGLHILGVDKYVAIAVIGSGPVLDPLQYYIRATIDNYRNSNGNGMTNDPASNQTA